MIISVAPTCTEKGYNVFICKTCKKEYQIKIEALGHDVIIHEKKDPTCQESGYNEYYTCSRCVYNTYIKIEAIDHNIVDGKCTMCDYIEQTENTIGLEYTLLNDNTYEVGIGTCTDSEIVIPTEYKGKKVTKLKDNAFYYCNGLTKITIPDSITSIGKKAFYSCSSLLEVEIPDSVISIGENAFAYCEALTKVKISNSITSIENKTFFRCIALVEVEIPNGVISIGEEAFSNCLSLTGINIPKSVTSIESEAFYNCTILTRAIIPSNAINIGLKAFCNSMQLTIYCEASSKLNEWDSQWNYSNCPVVWGYTVVEPHICDRDTIISSVAVTCTKDGYTVYKCNICDTNFRINFVALGHNIKVYEEKQATCQDFGHKKYESCSRCSYSTYEVIPMLDHNIVDGKCTICNNGEYSTGLKYILLDNDTYEVSKGTCTDDEVVVPTTYRGKDVTSIAENGFYNYENLKKITLPETIKEIKFAAFSYCMALENIEIPDSVTTIGHSAFFNCMALKSIKLSNSLTQLDSQVFCYCTALTSIEIPNSVTSIGNSTFDRCTALKSIKMSNNVTSIGTSAFLNCTALTNIEIPNSVTSIAEGAFQYCSSLKSIKIPTGVTSIADSTFYSCKALASIEIPDSVTSIGESAFYRCKTLTSIKIPNNVISIGKSSFKECTSLKNIELSTSLTSIGESAFYDCTSLTNAKLTNGVISIGKEAFYNCTLLKEINIPDTITCIGESAFYKCTSLINIIIPDSVIQIDQDAFTGCNSLSIYCEASSKPSGWSTFWNMSRRPVEWGYKVIEPHTCYGETIVSLVDATCFEGGYIIYKCDICEENYQVNIEALGHELIKHESKDPTCTENGNNAYEECVRCTYSTIIILPKKGHIYNTLVTPPTTSSQGYTLYTCEICNHSYNDNYEPIINEGNALKVSNTNIKALRKEEFKTTLYIEEGSNVKEFTISLSYNKDLVTLISYNVLNGLEVNVSNNNIVISYTKETVVTSQLDLIELTFKVDNEISEGKHDKWLYLSGDSSSNISSKITPLHIRTKGDAYDNKGDGKINARDASLILQHAARIIAMDKVDQYYANVYEDYDTSGNPKISARDASLILQYASRMPVTINDRYEVVFYVLNENNDYVPYITKSVKKGTSLTSLPKLDSEVIWSLSNEEYIEVDFSNITTDLRVYEYEIIDESSETLEVISISDEEKCLLVECTIIKDINYDYDIIKKNNITNINSIGDQPKKKNKHINTI